MCSNLNTYILHNRHLAIDHHVSFSIFSQLLRPLIESPPQFCNISDSTYKVVDSPVMPLQPHLPKIIASHTRPYLTQKPSSNIIETVNSRLLHNSSPQHKRSRLYNLSRTPVKCRTADKRYPSSHLKSQHYTPILTLSMTKEAITIEQRILIGTKVMNKYLLP